MGQKTHPYGFRLGVIKTWNSKWYEDKQYGRWLHEDLKLRKAIKAKYAHAGIAGIEIERAANKAKVVISTSRPGIIIGKRGAGVEQLKNDLQRLTDNELFIDIQEVRKAETNA
jgi:small subunit ribosomal protein S3